MSGVNHWQVEFCDENGGFIFNFVFDGTPTKQDVERIARREGIDSGWMRFMMTPYPSY